MRHRRSLYDPDRGSMSMFLMLGLLLMLIAGLLLVR
jgi:hypothetical protein